MWNQQEDIDHDLQSLAKEILSIPCTETACERLFSALSRVTSSSLSNIGADTVEARLLVNFNYVFKKAGKFNIIYLNKDTEKTLNLKKCQKNSKNKLSSKT